MRWLLLLALYGGCGSPEAPSPIEERGSADVPPDDAWAWIEALAKPRGAFGPPTDLDQALLISNLDGTQWFELEFSEPPPPLADYPGGKQAIDYVTRWMAAGGGLPQRTPYTQGLVALDMLDVGDLVIATATAPEELRPAIYIGTVLVTSGHDLLAIQHGVTMLERVKKKLHTMDTTPATAFPLIELDVARSFAAEATRAVRLTDWYKSPTGAKDVTAKTHVPTDAEIETHKAFWIRALGSATRGEPSAVTRRRLFKAAKSALEVQRVEAYLQTLDSIELSLVALHPN